MTQGNVPVVDIAGLVRGRPDAGCLPAIDAACRDPGFFYIQNHGLEGLTQGVWDAAAWFFGLPPADKQAVARTETNSRGYYDRELTKNRRDMKEVFDFGHAPAPRAPADDPANRTPDGWNQWPAMDGGEIFRARLEAWFEACHGVGLRLLEALATNLGVAPERLRADFEPRHSSFLRLNHYPVHDPLQAGEGERAADSGHLGVHHHTDAGALTLLLQDEVGGLQIRRAGRWVSVPPIEGSLVVNIGDIVQVWSNDTYRAPLHRVVASRQCDRYSLPFFFNPGYQATYAPLEAQVGPDRPPRYRSIHWGHFRQQRQHGDYGDYGHEIQVADFRVREPRG